MSCIYVITVAPSAPPNQISVGEIYSDSVYLSWRPPSPEHRNGEIIGYNVTLTVTSTGEEYTILSASNSTILSSLNPFTTYTFMIAAVTDAGVGPRSTAINFMTDEAGTMRVLTLYIAVVILVTLLLCSSQCFT